MRASKRICVGVLGWTFALLAGCASAPPLHDTITRIPVSDKADIASGVEMDYFMGSREGYWSDVACGAGGACWYSGQALVLNNETARTNPIVARMTPDKDVVWARTYEVDENYTRSYGMVPTPDGGTLMFGTTVSGSKWVGRRKFTPTYEKLDTRGKPEWGAVANVAGTTNDSAFIDAARLPDGGFALVGSAIVRDGGHGLVLRTDDKGRQKWLLNLRSRGEPTTILAITRLDNGDILAAGVNDKLHDIVLFDISPKGVVKRSPIVHIRGRQVPQWFTKTPSGPALLVSDKMPSGEVSALVIRANKAGDVTAASRYRFVDGFLPYGFMPLSDGRLCVYGISAATDHKQSLAMVANAQRQPVAALSMKGDNVYMSGATQDSSHVVLAGGRPLGVKQHASGIIVTWDPTLKSSPPLLRKFQRNPVSITVHKNEGAKSSLEDEVVTMLAPDEMRSRLVSGGRTAANGPQTAGSAVRKR